MMFVVPALWNIGIALEAQTGVNVSQDQDPVFGLTAGMTKVIWKLAQALACGDKAPDLTDVRLLSELQAAEHDVTEVLRLLSRRKGNGLRVLLRSLVQMQSLENGGRQLDLRRLAPVLEPTYLQPNDRLYVIAEGDIVLRRLLFQTDPTRPFEEC